MKCKFVLDQDADTSCVPESEKPKLSFRKGGIRTIDGRVVERPIPYFAKGTVYEHPDAYKLVQNGQAVPADDECTKACGLTAEELDKAQALYKKLDLGILPEDEPLYAAQVILGYDQKSPDGYIHGPNWDAYQKAMAEVEQEEAKALLEPAVPVQPVASAAIAADKPSSEVSP